MTVSATAGPATVAVGSTVVVGASATLGSVAKPGASVTVTVRNPRNRVTTFNGVTDAAGRVAFTIG